MDKILELRQKIKENLAAMQQLIDLADGESRDLTDEEIAGFDKIDGETDKLKKDLVRLEKLESERQDLERREDQTTLPLENWRRSSRAPSEFQCLGEFIFSVRFNRGDPRLQDSYREFETREQSMGSGVEGGFAVPEQFRPTLLQVTPQESIVRPRAQVIEAGDPPDAKITMPALDQTADENVYGGVVVAPVAEGGTKPETDLRLKEVSLEPDEVAGYITVTDKLLRNWAAASSLLGEQIRKAIIGWEDTQFLLGNGVGKPLGATAAGARIEVNRATASQIATADVFSMFARMKFGGSLVWVASQTILPQLLALKGGNNENIFVANAAAEMPMSLLGIPLLFNDRSPALGSTGDLCLIDWGYYLIKDGSGIFVEASPHVYFTSNKTVIKAFWNVDGKPWLSEPLPLEGSTTNTVSPFVILK